MKLFLHAHENLEKRIARKLIDGFVAGLGLEQLVRIFGVSDIYLSPKFSIIS